ncbi:MAG: acyltransferase [Minisyncoccia bacterium]
MIEIHTPKVEKQRYPYLDAMRGIAILLVIMYHTTIFMIHSTPNILYRISGEGARGVQIFYIVSALTLCMSLSASFFTGKRLEQIKFWIRRFFRIAPAFYFVIIISTVIGVLFPLWKSMLYLDINSISVISAITFTNNFLPEYINSVIPGQWSVAIEMFFYLTVPLFFLRIKSLSSAKKYFFLFFGFACLIELLLPMFLPAIASENTKIFLFYTIPIQLPTFLLGFIAFFMLRENEHKPFWMLKEFTSLLLIVSASEIIFLALRYFIFHNIDISLITPRVYIESVLFLGLVLLLAKGYVSFLQNKVFQYIGKISYSIYLVQFIAFFIITKNSIYPIVASYFHNGVEEYIFLSVATILLCVGISSLTFKYIETPGQKLGNYIYKKVAERYNRPSSQSDNITKTP